LNKFGDGTAHVGVNNVLAWKWRLAQYLYQSIAETLPAVPMLFGEPDHIVEQVAGVVVAPRQGVVDQHRHGRGQQDRHGDLLAEHDPKILGGELRQRLSPKRQAAPNEVGGVRTRIRLPNALDLFDRAGGGYAGWVPSRRAVHVSSVPGARLAVAAWCHGWRSNVAAARSVLRPRVALN
jgi:hypothetical protein